MFNSTLERDAAYILLTHPSVADLRDQVPVEYKDEAGLTREHIFDFIADRKDGTSAAVPVKPARKVESSGIRKTVDLIQRQRPDVADHFDVCTDDHLAQDRAADARLLLRAMRDRNKAHIDAVMAAASKVRGSVRIESLLEASQTGGHGFMAVCCLIADGVLEHLGPGRISHTSFVRHSGLAGSAH